MMRLSKTNGSCSSMRSSVELATVVLAVILIASGSAFADGGYDCSWIVGKKFNISNITPYDGTPPCPPSSPNTVAFYPGPYNGLVINGTVKVVGEFEGGGFGVCANTFYGIDPSVTITYEIWGDWVVYRFFPPNVSVSRASKVVPEKNGHGVAFINNANDFEVSILTYVGQAK